MRREQAIAQLALQEEWFPNDSQHRENGSWWRSEENERFPEHPVQWQMTSDHKLTDHAINVLIEKYAHTVLRSRQSGPPQWAMQTGMRDHARFYPTLEEAVLFASVEP